MWPPRGASRGVIVVASRGVVAAAASNPCDSRGSGDSWDEHQAKRVVLLQKLRPEAGPGLLLRSAAQAVRHGLAGATAETIDWGSMFALASFTCIGIGMLVL